MFSIARKNLCSWLNILCLGANNLSRYDVCRSMTVSNLGNYVNINSFYSNSHFLAVYSWSTRVFGRCPVRKSITSSTVLTSLPWLFYAPTGKCQNNPPRLPSKSLPIHDWRIILTFEALQFCVTDTVSKYNTNRIHERREIFRTQT